MAIIGVDVDQTIVPSCTLWGDWVAEKFGFDVDKLHFNHDVIKDIHLEWWKDKYLYDDMEPYPDAVLYLNKLAKDHKIWFITKCFDEHIDTKLQFVHKYFKADRFFNTGFNKADSFDGVIHYMIDDRPCILSEFKITKCFRVDTTVEPITDEFKLLSWKDIYNKIRSE